MKYFCTFLVALILALPISGAQGVFTAEDFPRINLLSGSYISRNNTASTLFVENTGFAAFGEKSLSPFNLPDSAAPYAINFWGLPATSVSIEFGDNDPDVDVLRIQAFDISGNLIAEATDQLHPANGFTSKRLTVEAIGIRLVRFIGGSNEKPNSVYYDNFRVGSKPVRSSFNDNLYGYADQAVFRDGTFYAVRFAGAFVYKAIHLGEGTPVTGDYDGDNYTDAAVFNNGSWKISFSTTGQIHSFAFGLGGDVPISADFDNDGKTDIAVFRSGFWYMLRSSDGEFVAAQFGQAGDVPIGASFDTDGRDDFAVYRPSDGTWYILQTKNGFRAVRFGIASDKPVPADYDGDGQTDIAVFRSGTWYLLQSRDGFRAETFGQSGDVPVPNDYFTDIPLQVTNGKADIAVFRPENGTWYIRTKDGFYARQWGHAVDIPISLAP